MNNERGNNMKKIIRLMLLIVSITLLTALASSVAVSAAELPFTDVEKDAWFYDDTRYLYRNGIMTGVTETEFRPEVRITCRILLHSVVKTRKRLAHVLGL